MKHSVTARIKLHKNRRLAFNNYYKRSMSK